MSWYTVRVPASSANLGPGFDSLGLALGVYLTCRFRRAEQLQIRVSGRDTGRISTGPDNLIWRTAQDVAEGHRAAMPPIELEIHNDIPLGRGMGSSAAALTAGVVIADQLLGLGWKALRVLDEAARLEGHPDNVAACTLGSIVASGIDSAAWPALSASICRRNFPWRLSYRILNCPRPSRAPSYPTATARPTPFSMFSGQHCSWRR